jgi:hypothetical protein
LKDVTNKSVESDDGEILKSKSSEGVVGGSFEELESSDEDDYARRKRPGKKRRSLLLPSDNNGVDILMDSLGSRGDDVSLEVAAAAASSKQVSVDVVLAFNDDNNNASKHQEMIQLVRRYCSLPLNKRVNSHEAKRIEFLSTYPMPGKILNVFNGDNETCKREFMLRAQPLVRLMEQQKQKDIDDARSFTGCEVKKGKGGFQYVDIKTLEAVTAEEYKDRYFAMIEDRKVQRRNQTVVNNSCSNEEASPFADDSNMDMDESVFSPDDSVVRGDDDKSVLSCARASYRECLVISSCTDEVSTPSFNAANTQEQKAAAVYNTNTTKPLTSSPENITETKPHPLLGALPQSDDPRVLEARRKLFRAIDTALATYSSEILALTQNNDGGGR